MLVILHRCVLFTLIFRAKYVEKHIKMPMPYFPHLLPTPMPKAKYAQKHVFLFVFGSPWWETHIFLHASVRLRSKTHVFLCGFESLHSKTHMFLRVFEPLWPNIHVFLQVFCPPAPQTAPRGSGIQVARLKSLFGVRFPTLTKNKFINRLFF